MSGKATECHFLLNSLKHMGAGLHSSQIVKIFFKEPKSSRDGSKCAWVSLSSEQRDLYISSYIYKYTYGLSRPDWLVS